MERLVFGTRCASGTASHRHGRLRSRSPVVWMLSVPLLLAAGACTSGYSEAQSFELQTGGDAGRGARLIRTFGCGSCHTVPGIRAADGVVGPPLYFFSRRTYIAGELPNTPSNLVHWIREPQSVEPGTAMPRLGLDEQQARDIAAYLYTLR